jgi:hypothetical protein
MMPDLTFFVGNSSIPGFQLRAKKKRGHNPTVSFATFYSLFLDQDGFINQPETIFKPSGSRETSNFLQILSVAQTSLAANKPHL